MMDKASWNWLGTTFHSTAQQTLLDKAKYLTYQVLQRLGPGNSKHVDALVGLAEVG